MTHTIKYSQFLLEDSIKFGNEIYNHYNTLIINLNKELFKIDNVTTIKIRLSNKDIIKSLLSNENFVNNLYQIISQTKTARETHLLINNIDTIPTHFDYSQTFEATLEQLFYKLQPVKILHQIRSLAEIIELNKTNLDKLKQIKESINNIRNEYQLFKNINSSLPNLEY